MVILAIDTVFDKCGVSILVDGEIIYHEEQTGKRQQTQQILPMIDKGVAESGFSLAHFDALVFNRGPGAFSGIRINTAVVQALSFAHDIPCVGVSSLQVLAQTGYEQHGIEHAYAVLDARMKQVYFAEYALKDDMMELIGDERLIDYGSHTVHDIPLFHLANDDKDLLSLLESQMSYQDIEPKAETLAIIGANLFKKNSGVSAEQALPVYLRNNAWKTLKEQGKSQA